MPDADGRFRLSIAIPSLPWLDDDTNPHGIRVVADRAPLREDARAAFLVASREATKGIEGLCCEEFGPPEEVSERESGPLGICEEQCDEVSCRCSKGETAEPGQW